MTPPTHQPLEELQANLIHLMNLYSNRPCSLTADAISLTLQGMLEHPLIDIFPELRQQCARGINQWRMRAMASNPALLQPECMAVH